MLKKFFKIIFSRFEGPPAWPEPLRRGEGPPQMPQTPKPPAPPELERGEPEAPKESNGQIFSYFEAEKKAEEKREAEKREKETGKGNQEGPILPGHLFEEIEPEGQETGEEKEEKKETEEDKPYSLFEQLERRPEVREKFEKGEIPKFNKEKEKETAGAEKETPKEEKEIREETEDKIPTGQLFEEMEFKKKEEFILPGHQFEGLFEEIKTQSPETKQEVEEIDDAYKKFLKDAEMKISAITDPKEQSEEYYKFIKDQILTKGDVESAKAFAGLIKRREFKDKAAEEIARSMEKAGLPEKEIVDFIGGKEGVKDTTQRDVILKELRKMLEIKNDINNNLGAQLEIISKMPDEGKKNEALAVLSVETAILGGNLEKSQEIMTLISKDEIREKAVSHIVKELAEKGKGNEIKSLLENIRNEGLKTETIGAIRETMERKLLGLKGVISPKERGRFNEFKEALKQAESSPDAQQKAAKWGKARKILLKILGWAGAIFGILALGILGLALEKAAGAKSK